jgi:uncharacterized protein YciW
VEDAKLKPILAYAEKLTLTPTRLTEADAAAVFAAGWSERALHDAVLTNFNTIPRCSRAAGRR